MTTDDRGAVLAAVERRAAALVAADAEAPREPSMYWACAHALSLAC